MSRPRKEKRETGTDASLQLVTANSTEESAVTAADNYVEVALEERKKDADKPLYIKRI
jgi:hypothetical protein